jgi:hypothetical protein
MVPGYVPGPAADPSEGHRKVPFVFSAKPGMKPNCGRNR